ncbi:LPS-assembly protein (Organic solvent tolerance protein) [Aggregatibacter aphrophilus NJ8700]|nr:LPS-assembly protein (Organic solvent tolerance protein) [Aggregatibacter aphrophilus NJ8700]
MAHVFVIMNKFLLACCLLKNNGKTHRTLVSLVQTKCF